MPKTKAEAVAPHLPKIDRLLSEYADAVFVCGEWRGDGSDETDDYESLSAAADAAQRKLRAAIAAAVCRP